MVPQPVVTGLSPKEGPPGTRITIRGEFLGVKASDLIGLRICGSDCLLSAEWKSSNKIIARTGPAKGKGDIIVTTLTGGVGTSTVQFRAYHETIGPMKESAVWVEESPIQTLAWGRRSLAPVGYNQEDPLGLSIEGNDRKFPEDLRDYYPESSGDLSQEHFSPGWFLLENHHATSFEDLKAGLSYLKRKVESQKEGQLVFLKSNAGAVINQLDTLVKIKHEMQENLREMDAAPLMVLQNAIDNSIHESYNIFNEVLARREKADSARAALCALSRHRFLFCLPNSIERNAKAEDFEVVVNDYARAKNLFGKTEIPIFRKVLEETDKRVVSIRKELYEKIVSMPQSVEQQKKFVKALVNLELQQGMSSQESEILFDPAWDAIEARSKYLETTFSKLFEEYLAKDAFQEKQKNRDHSNIPVRVMFCEEICDVASNQFPDLWKLGQSYFTGELKGSYEPRPANFKRIILNCIERFCAYLKVAVLVNTDQRLFRQLTGLCWPFYSPAQNAQFCVWIPQCLRYIRVSYAILIQLDLPNEALNIIQKLIDEVRLFCLSTIFKSSIDKIKSLSEKESWIVGVEDFPGATMLPSLLEEIIISTLEEAQNSCINPEIREGNLLEPHSEGQREMSQKLQDMLKAFCEVIENLAFQTDDDDVLTTTISQLIGFPNSQQMDYSKRDFHSVVSWERRILCCMANSAFCNKSFFPHIGSIFVRYGFPNPKIAIESSRSIAYKLFSSLLESYVEHKSDPLVGTIEPSMYIGRFQWDRVYNVNKLRPYAHECCDNLVGVYSEIYTISPFLLRPILEPIVQTVAEELARLMSCVQKFCRKGALQATIDIKLLWDALKFYTTEAARSFFMEALEAIGILSETDEKEIKEILLKIKKEMKLQLMCFSITEK
uniref:Exocyst complex component 2 n=1 Tax=Tabanus bromius TaxID=304241 RepID=A0A0K8TTG7_TABBR